jgi:CDP-glucose 4,6-dehydratase
MGRGFWQDRSVFVTGATGLLGGWLTMRLLKEGANVTALVRNWGPTYAISPQNLLSRVNVVTGDIRDAALLKRILGESEIEIVFHLAAQAIVSVANRNPVSTFESNIQGTWNVLEACRRAPKVKAVLVASSDKAYGEQATLPYTEEMPLMGSHPYEVSKACADLITQAYITSYDLPAAITRCGNFYGGGDLNWNRVVPGTIRSVVRGEAPIIRSDGQFVRDYFYVEDGAAAYMLLAQRMIENPAVGGSAYNFSNEARISVIDLVSKILAKMGSELQPVIQNQAVNEIRHQFLSAERAHTILQWKPQFTLDEGLDRTIAWYREALGARR